jgi:transglutaminase-like putative cysteine protease/predicted Zn-dependent protease
MPNAPAAVSPAKGPAAKPGAAKAKPDYSKEGVVYESISTVYRYQADGTGERDSVVVARVQSENAVHQAGLLGFTYASGNERLEVEYVRVRKSDGTVVATPAADAQDLPTEVTRQAPFYSDLREIQIPVKSLSPGDELEYKVHETLQKPLAPGEFWGAANFSSGAVVLKEEFELSYPKDKYALVLSPTSPPAITEENGRKVYRWQSSQLEPTPSDPSKQTPPDPDALPSISWTTFHNWEEVGAWYSTLARDRANVTPEIQSKADELVKGKTTDDEKIEAIYDYVSTQVRYIGIAFGIGRYQPHSAEAVLDNQYGDCKDKHTLLAALLKAAGYDAWPALIGTMTRFHAELPAPSQFDHVITVVSLPSGPIWLDSTPEVTPYRLLIAPLRDKEALVMPSTGPAKLMRTPADGPFPFVDEFTAVGKLSDDGTLTGHLEFKLRGDTEVAFREGFHSLARAQWQQGAQNASQTMGFAGSISNLDVSLPEKTAAPFDYSYDYERKQYADWANHRITPLTMPVNLTNYGDEAPQKPVQLGSPRREVHTSTIELPADYTATTPDSVKYKTAFATYEAVYKLEGNKYVATRTLNILQREVPVKDYAEYSKFVKNVEDDENQYTQLYVKGARKVDFTANNPEADRLIQAAFADIARKDLTAARADLHSAEQLSPHQRGLQIGYAYADMEEHHLDEAAADYRKELEAHPENVAVYRALAGLLVTMKRPGEAEQTLRDGLKMVPGDKAMTSQLSYLLMQQKNYSEASTLLENALKASPDDRNLAIQAGRAEILAGKKDAGVANLRAALTASSDPKDASDKDASDAARDGQKNVKDAKAAQDAEILNDAAYELANAGVELPLAESSCRKSLDMLETQLAQTTLGNLSREDLQRVNLLTAAWDTMGWIYFREGNLPMAEKYIAAAWASTQHSEVGDHLAQVYEKEGRLQDAADIYSLAAAAGTLSPDPSGDGHIHEGLKRLAAQGYLPKSKTPGEDLGKERSITLPRLAVSKDRPEASGDFFLLYSAGKLEDVQFIKGSEELRASAADLKAKNIPAAFPEGSEAKIVRRGILYCSDALKGCQFTLLLPQSTTLN